MHFYSICDITFGTTRVYWKHLNEFIFNLLVQARIKISTLFAIFKNGATLVGVEDKVHTVYKINISIM